MKRLRQLACSVQESQAPHNDKAKWVASEQLQATTGAFKQLYSIKGSSEQLQMILKDFEQLRASP